MGRTKTSPARLPTDELLRPYLIEPADLPSWPNVFGNDHPVELEVGCGKGLFLVSAAAAHPKRNYFGIELAKKFARFTAARLAQHSLLNARVLNADARRVVTEWIPDSSVSVLHVYFPDPWWKRRHHKRRIFTDSFLTHVVRVLRQDGELRFASDVEEYYKEIEGLIRQHSAFEPLEQPSDPIPQHDRCYLTNFERKYLKLGKQIFRTAYRKSL